MTKKKQVKSGSKKNVEEEFIATIEAPGCCTLYLGGGVTTVPGRVSRATCIAEANRQGAARYDFQPGVDCP